MRQSIQALIDRINADHDLQKKELKYELGLLRNMVEPALLKERFWELNRLYFLAEQITERLTRMQQLEQQRRDLENLLEELKGGDVC